MFPPYQYSRYGLTVGASYKASYIYIYIYTSKMGYFFKVGVSNDLTGEKGPFFRDGGSISKNFTKNNICKNLTEKKIY